MKRLTALLILLLSFTALGAETKKKSLEEVLKENNITKSELRNEMTALLHESKANREGKRFSLLLGTGGRHDMMMRTFSAEYFIQQNTTLGLSYSTGKYSYAYFEDQVLENMEAKIVEAYSKLCLGNSFFTKIGVAYRSMEGEG